MSEREKHIGLLFTAELQFRLASAVRLATSLESQPLDLPQEWTHGRHSVMYEEIALRQDEADYAACFLQKSSTFLLAIAMRNAICAVVTNPKTSPDPNVCAAYQITRMIRNAFAHSPFAPTWFIDDNCRDKVFIIPDIIKLDTTGLDGTSFDWRHYGSPLALFRLCQFVRTQILKDEPAPRKVVPIPRNEIYQQGDLILKKVEKVPPDALPTKIEKLPDGGIPLGGGHVIYPAEE